VKLRPVPRRRSTRILLVATLLAVVGGTVAAVPSWADTPVVYAALGDSYASGVGAPPYDPTSGGCRQSPRSAARLWAESHGASFTFAACSGATTTDVINNQLAGLTSATTLVTITIGANDLHVLEGAITCVTQGDAACLQVVNAAEAAIVTTVRQQLENTYAQIKAKAPNARLIVLGYPRPFELTPSCPQTVSPFTPSGIDVYSRGLANHAADLLDQVTQDRAVAAGATFVDVRSAFAGHGICSDSPWIQAIANPIDDSGHPTAEGYRSGYLQPLLAVTG
jgi:lysophospholipase L1-like esterase